MNTCKTCRWWEKLNVSPALVVYKQTLGCGACANKPIEAKLPFATSVVTKTYFGGTGFVTKATFGCIGHEKEG